MAMTPEARSALRTTIRSLRERLLADLHAETGRVYRLAVRARRGPRRCGSETTGTAQMFTERYMVAAPV
jgi:hypothetical protein